MSADDALTRFFEHLPKSGDIDLSLLKGHLLCEEVLTRCIQRNLKNPKPLMNARLTFAHKSILAKCMYPREDLSWVWPALKKLNDARNELSHALAREVIDQHIEEFVQYVELNEPKPEEHLLTASFGRLHWAMFKVFIHLAVVADYNPTIHAPSGLLGLFAGMKLEDKSS